MFWQVCWMLQDKTHQIETCTCTCTCGCCGYLLFGESTDTDYRKRHATHYTRPTLWLQKSFTNHNSSVPLRYVKYRVFQKGTACLCCKPLYTVCNVAYKSQQLTATVSTFHLKFMSGLLGIRCLSSSHFQHLNWSSADACGEISDCIRVTAPNINLLSNPCIPSGNDSLCRHAAASFKLCSCLRTANWLDLEVQSFDV